jgi:hypothetical protein
MLFNALMKVLPCFCGVSPARGGGGSPAVTEACWLKGEGTAPGRGGGGPSFCCAPDTVREGTGAGRGRYGVGAGTAAAPGRACGYCCAGCVVVAALLAGAGTTGASADVSGVMSSAFVGVMGSSMWTGIGGIL